MAATQEDAHDAVPGRDRKIQVSVVIKVADRHIPRAGAVAKFVAAPNWAGTTALAWKARQAIADAAAMRVG